MLSKPILVFLFVCFSFVSDILLRALRRCQWEGMSINLSEGDVLLFYFCQKYLDFYLFITLQYCVGFAIHQHESATGVHVLLKKTDMPLVSEIPLLGDYPEDVVGAVILRCEDEMVMSRQHR